VAQEAPTQRPPAQREIVQRVRLTAAMEAPVQTEAGEGTEVMAAPERLAPTRVSLSLLSLQSTELTAISPEVEMEDRAEPAARVELEAVVLPEAEVVTASIAPVRKAVPAPAAMAEAVEMAVKVVTAASADQVDKEEAGRTLP
jgi:hypothetical protein